MAYSGKELRVDGKLNQRTVTLVMSILAETGLPPGVPHAPSSDEDIAKDARLYAEHIAAKADLETDFLPREVSMLTIRQDSIPVPGLKKKLFSKKNIAIGSALVGGFLIFR